MELVRIANKREQETFDEHSKEGWKCINKGFPDFLFYKDLPNGKTEGFFVEVKTKIPQGKIRNGVGTGVYHLLPHQEEMHKVLRKMGFEVKVIYKD